MTKEISDENLSYESFLGELSAELVNLPLKSIDAAIESSMKSLVEFFDADFGQSPLRDITRLCLYIEPIRIQPYNVKVFYT